MLRYFASPGFLGEWMQIYLARDIREGVATPELDEQIEIAARAALAGDEDGRRGQDPRRQDAHRASLYDAARRDGRL